MRTLHDELQKLFSGKGGRYEWTEASWADFIAGNFGGSGTPGPTGPQGDPGPQGIQGEQGEQGLFWLGAWNALTMYQVDDAVQHNGSAYIALILNQNSEPPNGDWDLIVSKGDTGGTGSTGPGGPAGAAGATGATGATGPSGPEGPPGEDGEAGPPGPAGATGATGATGSAGGAGSTGPAGPMGPPGSPGDQGEDGVEGPMGPQGPVGPTGATGATGPAGVGPQGPPGPPGEDGADGEDGLPGAPAGPSIRTGGGIINLGVGLAGTFDFTGIIGLASRPIVIAESINIGIPSKGSARDECEMDPLAMTGYRVDQNTIRVFWSSISGAPIVGDRIIGWFQYL